MAASMTGRRRKRERSRFLQEQGYRILRLWNNDVLSNPEGVYAAITEEFRRHPLPTLPHQGGRALARDIKQSTWRGR